MGEFARLYLDRMGVCFLTTARVVQIQMSCGSLHLRPVTGLRLVSTSSNRNDLFIVILPASIFEALGQLLIVPV